MELLNTICTLYNIKTMVISGRLIDENHRGIEALTIVVYSINLGIELGDKYTKSNDTGGFSFNVSPMTLFMKYRIRIYRGAKVLLYESDHFDLAAGDWDAGEIVFHSQFITGWFVRDRISGKSPMLSEGNKIEYHIDNQTSWSSLSNAIKNAQTQVHMQQFYFLVNKTIFDFNGRLTLEQLLTDASIRNVDVKLIIRDVTFAEISITSAHFVSFIKQPLNLKEALTKALRRLQGLSSGTESIFNLGLKFAPQIAPLLGYVLSTLPGVLNSISTGDIVVNYFTSNGNSKLKVKKFSCDFFSPLHAKYTLIDNEIAYFTASPFYNGYFGTQDHLIKDERYGNSNVTIPVHDVSLKLEGNAILFLRDTYIRYWNNDGVNDTFTPPVLRSFTGPDTATVQINKTILKSTFMDMPKGEATIFESYLRAINESTDYIYIENQYLIDERIYSCLKEKIKSSTVQLIAVVNMNMDIPGYNNLQQNRINSFKRELKGKESQFGFFTIWTHQTGTNIHYLINNYVHSKVGIIDDKWATLGSANLDEYSLQNDGGHEINVAIFNGVEANKPLNSLPETLRNKLWNEHLFGRHQISNDIIARPSSSSASSSDWLALWKQKAKEKLDYLKMIDLNVPASRILEWVDKSSATDYLKELGVENFEEDRIQVYDKIQTVYDFKEAQWVENDLCNTIKDFSK